MLSPGAISECRIRAQDWYHDLSEEESDEEIERQLASAQQRRDPSGHSAQRPRGEDRSDLGQQFEQFRREQAANATEAGRSFVLIVRYSTPKMLLASAQLRKTVMSLRIPTQGTGRTAELNHPSEARL